MEVEENNLKRRKLEFLANTEAFKNNHQHLMEFEKEVTRLSDLLIPYFESHWKNLDTSGAYKVKAFTVNNKGKFPYVEVLAEKDDSKSVYYIKGFHKNVFISANNAREDLKKNGFIKIPYDDDMDLFCLPRQEPFCLIEMNGMTTYKGHSFPKIEKLEFLPGVWKNLEDTPFTQQEAVQFNEISMLEIKGKVKVGQCCRLEQLKEGVELVIVAIKEIVHRGKMRYILQFENVESLYVSNYWLEKELDDSDVDLDYKIKIKLDVLKYTPVRHKERVVFCV